MTKTVGYYTLGCKLNYAETDAIARKMEDAGYERVSFTQSADYYIINTCSVTESANKKSRYAIRKALRQNTQAKIIIVGCYAQLKPDELAELEGASLIIGTKDKFSIPQKIKELEQNSTETLISSCDICDVDGFESSYSLASRTRSFLKVQDGCDYKCSYCTIPFARGNSRNAPISEIKKQAHEIAQAGAKEIVLTGINIGDFGQSTGETFLDLLQELDSVPGIERIRISSIEPNLLTTEIIQFVADSKRCMPHFHIPLQSGSEQVLRLMRRRYTPQLFADKVHEIKAILPHACIAADVIVGTPGETEEYFVESQNFIRNLPISYLHVFTYSERDGTAALHIEPKVNIADRNKRSEQLHVDSKLLQEQFYLSCLNQIRPVLFESKAKNGLYTGYTDNYIKVFCAAKKDVRSQIKQVRLHTLTPEGIIADSEST